MALKGPEADLSLPPGSAPPPVPTKTTKLKQAAKITGRTFFCLIRPKAKLIDSEIKRIISREPKIVLGAKLTP